MSKANQWSLRKTLGITLVCGFAHVLSSVVIGLLVVMFGLDLAKALAIETGRGAWAAWGMVALGIGYGLYKWNQTRKNQTHDHEHTHADGLVHSHPHNHHSEHAHGHLAGSKWSSFGLFLVFLVGPCEVLVPVLIVPAGTLGLGSALLVSGVFCLATLVTMVAMVTALVKGVNLVNADWFNRHAHWVTGGTIATSGFAILLLGG